MNIKDYFTAESQSMMEFLTINGQGLYVPAYQRQFTWDESKLEKLVNDAVHGLKKLINQEDSVTFIGTVIAIHDTTNATVNPPNKSGLPSRVMTIIDGQQRLTSLLMLSTMLHECILNLKKSYKFDYEKEADQWLDEAVQNALGNLQKCFIDEQNFGTGDFKWYPRMTRSYQDIWDKRSGQYESPIGKHLFNYGIYVRKCTAYEDTSKYEFLSLVDSEKKQSGSVYFKFNEGLNTLRRLINKIARQELEEYPTDKEIINSSVLPKAILNNQVIPEAAFTLITESNSIFSKLTRLIIFANFVLHRIGLTVVTAKTEDYAFDIFEALNTTGEPLTAYETFKPKVIYKSTLSGYADSAVKKWMEIIDEFFDHREDANKQDITSKLLISFALAESGTKLSSRITDQRGYLRKFDKIPEHQLNAQLEFVQSLACAVDFYSNVWTSDLANIGRLTTCEADKDTVKLCIDVLRGLKHNITHGPLIRYYTEAILAEKENKLPEKEVLQKKQDFIDVLKACTVFSILWRGSRRGTAGIDNEYRKLMFEGRFGFNPLSRTDKEGAVKYTLPSVEDFKRILCKILATNKKAPIRKKEDWVKGASELGQFDNNRIISRFLIIAARHDAIPDPQNPGLLMKGRKGVCSTLTYDYWKNEQTASIEHIAPQTRDKGWLAKEYDQLYGTVAKDKLHTLGNLTLLNTPENSSLSNRSWAEKRILYQALSAKDEGNLEIYLDKAQQVGISRETIKKIRGNSYIHAVEEIGNYDGQYWTDDIIDQRSQLMASFVWDNLFPWLKPACITDDLMDAIPEESKSGE